MTEPLKTVSPGRPLAIPASTWNAFVEIARAHRAAKAGMSGGAQVEPQPAAAGIVLVRNDSGSGQSQFAVLGVDAPIILPADNEREFRRCVALSCVTPEAGVHEGQFVILLEPLASGAVGRAAVAGVVVTRVNVPDEAYSQADIADGVTGSLLAVESGGSAAILWRAGGTGVQWAVVRLANEPSLETRLKAAGEQTWLAGDVTVAVAGPATVGQDDETKTITITVGDLPATSLKIATAETWLTGAITFAADGAASLAQDDETKTITVSASDTVTRLKASGAATWLAGDITVAGTGLAGVTQNDGTKTITVNVPSNLCSTAGQAAALSKDLGSAGGSAETGARCDQKHPSRAPAVAGAIPTNTVSGDYWIRNPA